MEDLLMLYEIILAGCDQRSEITQNSDEEEKRTQEGTTHTKGKYFL